MEHDKHIVDDKNSNAIIKRLTAEHLRTKEALTAALDALHQVM